MSRWRISRSTNEAEGHHSGTHHAEAPDRSGEEPAEITDPEEVEVVLQETAGLWKDRTDLPDLAAMRREWDERMKRLFGDS